MSLNAPPAPPPFLFNRLADVINIRQTNLHVDQVQVETPPAPPNFDLLKKSMKKTKEVQRSKPESSPRSSLESDLTTLPSMDEYDPIPAPPPLGIFSKLKSVTPVDQSNLRTTSSNDVNNDDFAPPPPASFSKFFKKNIKENSDEKAPTDRDLAPPPPAKFISLTQKGQKAEVSKTENPLAPPSNLSFIIKSKVAHKTSTSDEEGKSHRFVASSSSSHDTFTLNSVSQNVPQESDHVIKSPAMPTIQIQQPINIQITNGPHPPPPPPPPPPPAPAAPKPSIAEQISTVKLKKTSDSAHPSDNEPNVTPKINAKPSQDDLMKALFEKIKKRRSGIEPEDNDENSQSKDHEKTDENEEFDVETSSTIYVVNKVTYKNQSSKEGTDKKVEDQGVDEPEEY